MTQVDYHSDNLFFRHPLFSGCTEHERDQLRKALFRLPFRSGEILARRGEDLPYFGVLTRGLVIGEGSEAKPSPVKMFLPLDAIGRPDRTRNSLDLRSASEGEICAISVPDLKDYLKDHPEALVAFLSDTLSKIGLVREWVWMAYHHDARQKVALFLSFMTRSLQHSGMLPQAPPLSFPLMMTRAEIGALLGLGLFTVSRQLNSLREEGIIDFTSGRTLIIRNLAELSHAAGLQAQRTALQTETGDDSANMGDPE